MNIEKNIENFQQWALGMGFSTENMPCEEAIKSIYKSRQAQLFSELLKRIQPLEIVQEARKNFIIESKKHSDDKIPIYNADITRQYDSYVKVEKLKKQQQNVQKKLEQHCSDYQNTIALLEVKNVHLTKEQAKQSKLQALKHIYKLKVHKLDMQISQEVKKAVSISNIIPVQYARYAEDEFTRKLVQQALAKINDFETTNEDGEVGKTKFWQEMRKIFYQLPNSTIYKHITNLHIKQMHKFNQLLEMNNQKVATDKRLNSIKAVDKRDGAGTNNWGSVKEAIDDASKKPDNDETQNEKNVEKETETNENATEQVSIEEETKELTLDEWKAKKGQRVKPTFNIRKAGEGEDTSQWKKMVALQNNKKKEHESEDELEFDPALYPQRVGRQQRVLDIKFNFNDGRRGGFGRRRGGPAGAAGFNGQQRREPRETAGPTAATSTNATGNVERPVGERPLRGAGGGGRRHFNNERQQHVPKVNDESQFPTLA